MNQANPVETLHMQQNHPTGRVQPSSWLHKLHHGRPKQQWQRRV